MAQRSSKPEKREAAVVAAAAIVLAAVLAALAFETGVTVDEPSHMVSSYLYWQGEDTLQPGDMPPLMKIMGGWVPHVTGLRLPARSHESWKSGHEWNVGLAMMEGLHGSEIRKIFGFTRLTMIPLTLGCALLIWWWGRQLYSPGAAMAAAAAFGLSSLVLGHGCLFKNDLAATFAFLFFWYRIWAFWRKPNAASAAWLGLAILTAMTAKFSLYAFLPLAPLIVGLRIVTLRIAPMKALAIAALLISIPYAGAHLAWQPGWERVPQSQLSAWSHNPDFPDWSSSAAVVMDFLHLPPRMIWGAMSLVASNGDKNAVYLMGRTYEGGHPAYFLIALAVKLHVPLILMILAGLGECVRRLLSRSATWDWLLWTLPPFLYVGAASMSSLQLGARLVLPAVAFLVLISGLGIERLLRARAGRAVIALLCGWLVVKAAITHPHHIASFNALVGGPENGLKYLSDSNVDWGQDAARIWEVMQKRRIPLIRLAYFGVDPPYRHMPERYIEGIAPPWSDDLVKSTVCPVSAGYYAISASMLTGQYFAPKYRDYFAPFRKMKPIAKAGYSIWIYKVEALALEPGAGGKPAATVYSRSSAPSGQ